MLTADAGQQERYRDAIDAVATHVMAELGEREPADEDYLDDALAELVRLEKEASSEHAWIFRDPAVLVLSDHLFEALDERPGARRDWLHADLRSAVAAVARFDVMAELVERFSFAGLDEDDAEVAETLKA